MKPDSVPQLQFLLPDLATMLDARQGLHQLARRIDWAQFESAFASLYKEGRPALPIRRMVGLLLLKQLCNLSDERVVEQWTLNPCFQFFCGEREFQWGAPCAASELVHFRGRIGPGGAEKLLACPIALHGEQAKEKEVVLGTTAQEKAITFPTDAKLRGKVIKTARRIAAKSGVVLRQSYARTVPKLLQAQRGWRHPRTRAQARKAARKLKNHRPAGWCANWSASCPRPRVTATKSCSPCAGGCSHKNASPPPSASGSAALRRALRPSSPS